MATEKYIVNGRTLFSYDAVTKYAKELGLRIVDTETLSRNVFLIALAS